MAVGSKGAIGLDLDWVRPTELEVNGLVIMWTKTDDLRCKLLVTVAYILLFSRKYKTNG